MTTAYVLIDFENVQPKELGAFGVGGFKVMVFVGPAQPTIPVGLASALQALGHAGSYVHVAGRGPNALDMHIAYYIGRLAVADPGAVFHIISRDRDYDPLILHLKGQGIECTRWKSIADINAAQAPQPAPVKAAAPKRVRTPRAAAARPAPKSAAKVVAKPAPDRVEGVIENLRKRARARPSTVKALASTIKSLYRSASDNEVALIVAELTVRGVITVDGEKVAYAPS